MKYFAIIIFFLSFSANANNFKLTYHGTPLHSVVETVSGLTSQSFTYDYNVYSETPITLITPNNSTSEKLLLEFSRSLRVVNLQLLVQNGVFMILPISEDDQESLNTVRQTAFFIIPPTSTDFSFEGAEVIRLSPRAIAVTATEQKLNDISRITQQMIAQANQIQTRVILLGGSLSPHLLTHLQRVFPDTNFTLDETRLLVTGRQSDFKKIESLVSQFSPGLQSYQLNVVVASVSTQEAKNRGFEFLLSSGSFSLSGNFLSYDSLSDLNSFSAFIEFLDRETFSSVVTRPVLQVQPDGETTSFTIGQEVSVRQSQVDQATGQIIQNFNRVNVGLSLSVSLKRTFSDALMLTMRQKQSNISGYDPNENPIFRTQDLTSTLHIKPNIVYVVGGVEDTRKDEMKNSLFGFIPTSKGQDLQKLSLFIYLYLEPLKTLTTNDLDKTIELSTKNEVLKEFTDQNFLYHDDEYWYVPR